LILVDAHAIALGAEGETISGTSGLGPGDVGLSTDRRRERAHVHLVESVRDGDVGFAGINSVSGTIVLMPRVFTTPLVDFAVLVDNEDGLAVSDRDFDSGTRDLFPLAVNTVPDFFILVNTPEGTIRTDGDTSGRAIELGPARAVPLVDFTSGVADDNVLFVTDSNVGSTTLNLVPRRTVPLVNFTSTVDDPSFVVRTDSNFDSTTRHLGPVLAVVVRGVDFLVLVDANTITLGTESDLATRARDLNPLNGELGNGGFAFHLRFSE